jgi:hypothetical protein
MSNAASSTDVDIEEHSFEMQENPSPTCSQRPILGRPSFTWSDHDTIVDDSWAEPLDRPFEIPPYTTSIDGEKTDDKQPEESLGAAQTRDDGTEYPQGVKLAVIVLALCLAIFLMALEYYTRLQSAIVLLNGLFQQFDHYNRHSKDHRRVQQLGRCWLVRKWQANPGTALLDDNPNSLHS